MFLCSHLCMYVCHYLFTCILKQLSWTGWPKVLDYAILAGAVIEPAPYPEVGLLTSSSSYCSFCFLFSPFVAFRWLRESPPALGFGHFSIAICQFPMHSQRISLQLKFCTFTLTPPSPYSHSFPPSLLQHVPRPPHPVRLLLAPWSNRAVRSSRMWMWRTSARCQCCPHRSLPSMDSSIASEAGRRRIALWKSTRA